MDPIVKVTCYAQFFSKTFALQCATGEAKAEGRWGVGLEAVLCFSVSDSYSVSSSSSLLENEKVWDRLKEIQITCHSQRQP